MFRPYYTPAWFNGWDIMFEGIIVLIALLIAAYSWKAYKLNKENRFAYFSIAFLLIALGVGLKIITNSIVYFDSAKDVALETLRPLAGAHLEFTPLLYRVGFFLQMVPVLGALLLIFFISQKPRDRLHKYYEVSQMALFVYLILLISVVSNFKYFVFYLTSAVLLGLITLNYYKNYLNSQNQNAFRVMTAFLIMLLGNLFFIFVFLVEEFYVIGEVLLLAGFLVLLYTYYKITQFKK